MCRRRPPFTRRLEPRSGPVESPTELEQRRFLSTKINERLKILLDSGVKRRDMVFRFRDRYNQFLLRKLSIEQLRHFNRSLIEGTFMAVKKGKPEKAKTFFVISALRDDSSRLGNLVRHETENGAIDHAKKVMAKRAEEGEQAIAFHVMKCVAIVAPAPATAPIRVTRVK